MLVLVVLCAVGLIHEKEKGVPCMGCFQVLLGPTFVLDLRTQELSSS